MNYYPNERIIPDRSKHKACSRKDLHLKIKIRLCTEQDIQKLEWFGMFYEHRNIYQLQYQRHLKQENIMLVADLNGFPVGQSWIDLCVRANESAALIWALRIHPILQNQGLGTFLLTHSEYLIRSRRIKMAQIEVEKSNIKALKLYERSGYSRFDEKQETWSFISPSGQKITGFSDLYILRKLLDSR